MKVKTVDMLILFDFYGEMLTDKQKELFDLYYNEDMSLAEISENTGITRQAVRDAVVRAEHILQQTEDKLGLVRRYGHVLPTAEKIIDCFEQIILSCPHASSDAADAAQHGIALARSLLSADSGED